MLERGQECLTRRWVISECVPSITALNLERWLTLLYLGEEVVDENWHDARSPQGLPGERVGFAGGTLPCNDDADVVSRYTQVHQWFHRLLVNLIVTGTSIVQLLETEDMDNELLLWTELFHWQSKLTLHWWLTLVKECTMFIDNKFMRINSHRGLVQGRLFSFHWKCRSNLANVLLPVQAYKKLFVSCNPTLTSFYFKKIPTLKFFPPSQIPINVKHA